MWLVVVLILVWPMRSFVSANETCAPLANLCLRNKTQPACQRSENAEPLEVEWIAIRDTVSKFVDRLNNGTLQLTSFDSHLNRDNPAKMCGLLNVATHLVDTCGLAAPLTSTQLCEMYWTAHDNFLTLVQSKHAHFVFTPTDANDKRKRFIAKRHVTESLNVMTFPETSLSNSSMLFCTNPMCMSDLELLQDITAYHSLTAAASNERSRREGTASSELTGADLIARDFELVKSAAPAHMGLWLEWVVCTTSTDGEYKCSLGITAARENQIRLSMDSMLVRGHEVAEKVNETFEHASASQRAYQMRVALQGAEIWRDPRLTHPRETILSKCPRLIEIVQGEAERLGAVFKGKGGFTPTDAYILPAGNTGDEAEDTSIPSLFGGAGGVVDQMHRTVNTFLVGVLKKDPISKTSVYGIMQEAGIVFKKLLANMTEPRIAQHYCAATLLYHRIIATLWSNSSRTVSWVCFCVDT
jgi:hypothetical protein